MDHLDYMDAASASNKLRTSAAKLKRESDILNDMVNRPANEAEHIDLLVIQAKRVRTASILAVRASARLRDQL